VTRIASSEFPCWANAVLFTREEKRNDTDEHCCVAMHSGVYSKNHICDAYISSGNTGYICTFSDPVHAKLAEDARRG